MVMFQNFAQPIIIFPVYLDDSFLYGVISPHQIIFLASRIIFFTLFERIRIGKVHTDIISHDSIVVWLTIS